MAREVQIIAWCDSNHESGQVPATHERRLSVDGGKVVLVDLCEACNTMFERAVLPFANAGVEAEKVPLKAVASAGREQHKCPECGFVSKSRPALGQHLSKRHRKGFKDYATA